MAMTIEELDQELPVVDGTLTLTTTSVRGILQPFLTQENGGQPLVIHEAGKTVTSTQVAINGSMSYLNVANAPVIAMFTVQWDGSVTATITMRLPGGWKFRTSFPNLPLFKAQSASDVDVLNALALVDAKFVIATASEEDPSGAPLPPGLNFIGAFDPVALSGLFGTILGGQSSYVLYGLIHQPQATEVTKALLPRQYPWEVDAVVPGISLQAPLDADFTIASLRGSAVTWRAYSPTDTAWLASNPTFEPLLAVSCALEVPSARITGDVDAVVYLGQNNIVLDCDFHGLTIAKLANLTDLVNGPDLQSILPKEIQSALGSIEVESASVALDGSFSASAVDYVSVEAGLPNVTWDILPGVFSVGSVGGRFIVTNPFTAERSLMVSISGTITLAGMSLDVVTDYPLFETLATCDDATVPLTDVFAALVPELPPPPDINVSLIEVGIVPGQSYSFSVRAADDPAWALDLGPVPMVIGSVTADVWDEGAGMQGTFSGTLEFTDDIETSIRYDTPGAFVIRTEIDEIRLTDYINRLDEIGLTLPAGFDITFADSYILIETASSGDLVFSVGTVVASLGLVAFTAEKNGGRWGYAAGVQLDFGGLAAIPGLEPLAEFERYVGLTRIMLLVSSLDDPGFQFPDMNAFNAQPLQGRSMPLPPQTSGVVKGVNVYAQLTASKDKGFGILAKYLGVELNGSAGLVIAISAPDTTTNSKLFLTVGMNVNRVTRLDGQMGVLVQAGEFGVFLAATVKTSIQGQPATFTVIAVVVPTGVLISGTMQGTITFDPVRLSNVAIEIGLDDAAIPSIGFAATVDVSNFESSIAIFFDSTDPAKSMFAGSLDDATLNDVAEAIAGQGNVPSSLAGALDAFALRSLSGFTIPSSVAPSLDARDMDAIRSAFAKAGVTLPSSFDQILLVTNTAGSVWHLTDLSTMVHYALRLNGSVVDVKTQAQIYFAPQTTFIGALKYPQGLHVMAEVDAFLLKAKVKVLVDAHVGISFDVAVAPIVIVSSNFFAVTAARSSDGPLLSMATFNQPQQTDPMLQPPHFLVTGAIRLLGSDFVNVYAAVSASGVEVALNARISPVVTIDLHGSFGGATTLVIGGGAMIGIDSTFDGGVLGRIHVVTTINGALEIRADEKGGRATVKGSFVFGGLTLQIPEVSLDITTTALLNLPSTLWPQIVDVLNKVLLASEQWLAWVAAGIMEGISTAEADIGHTLDSAYHIAGEAIADQTQRILHYDVDGVTKALEGAGYSAAETASILEEVGYTTEEIAGAIEDVFSGEGHVDLSIGHIDTPAGPHADTPETHTDTPESPHVDATESTETHADAEAFGVHADENIPGTEFHADTPLYPHVDETIAHQDALVPPHGDSETHVDTN